MAKHFTKVIDDLKEYVDSKFENGDISESVYMNTLAAIEITLEVYEEYESWQ